MNEKNQFNIQKRVFQFIFKLTRAADYILRLLTNWRFLFDHYERCCREHRIIHLLNHNDHNFKIFRLLSEGRNALLLGWISLIINLLIIIPEKGDEVQVQKHSFQFNMKIPQHIQKIAMNDTENYFEIQLPHPEFVKPWLLQYYPFLFQCKHTWKLIASN